MRHAGITRRAVVAAGTAAPFIGRRCFAAAMPAPALSVTAMRADLTLLAQIYTALHPGLYRYATPRGTATRFAAERDALVAPLSLGAFYLRLSRLLATVRCGHSYANFYNQPRAVQQALFEGDTRLPLEFLWLGNRMVVTGDPFDTGIARGSEVLAIDGRPAGEVLAALLPYVRADGHNDAKRRRLLSVQNEDGYETFDVFHALRFGGRGSYQLLVSDPDGRRRTANVRAVTLAQRRRLRVADAQHAGAPIWTIERRGDASVLTMPSWGLYNATWDWRSWLDTEVDRLIADRVPRLIVDLRHNEGGEDCGNALIARLSGRATPFFRERRLVRYATLPATFRPYCDTWDRSFDHLGEKATRFDARFLQLPTASDETDIAPKGPRYAGRVFVLVSPQNSSATFQFAQVMQRERLGTLIGEETGGNRRGINGGCFYFVRLPETGLEADLPLIGTFPLTPQPDGGMRPDIPVAPSPADFATGRDPVMARALDLAA